MFSVDKFYRDAYNGESIEDITGFHDYINSFETVIIWGAGNLGKAVHAKFSELGIKLTVFWDAKHKEKKVVNGISVIEPFTGDFNKDKSIVIFCIANVPLAPPLFARLHQEGWTNRLKGVAILEGLICPLKKGEPIDTGVCSKLDICSVCSCERLSNLMKARAMERENVCEDDVLCFDRVHFIINNFCNLKCTHCYMYMNTYPANKKKNMDIETQKNDIRLVMETIHSFGVVNVFGGEPFLHPQLDDIVRTILEYDNFGSLLVNTNGAAKMHDNQMQNLTDARVRLAFSNYREAMTEQQNELVTANFHHAQELGINAQMMNDLPTWNISSTLCNNHSSIEQMSAKKDACGVKFLYVFDHKVFPCAFSLSIKDLGVADYPDTYIDLNVANSPKKLRKAIREMFAREYFHSCGHCDNMGVMGDSFATVAGEQGFSERYALPTGGSEP